MQQSTLIAILEEVAPPVFAAPWDKSGIQAASSRVDIGHLAVSLDPAPTVVRRALSAGADMLLTHHPLTLQPRYPDRLDAYHETLALLFSHNIPLYSAHTSLDANPEGPAAWLADELGLTRRVLLEKTGVLPRPGGSELAGGFGCVGDLPGPLALAQLATRLRNLLPLDRTNAVAHLIDTPPPLIRRIAVCAGSGSSLLDSARREGAELYITGDVKYHTALDLVSENVLIAERNAGPVSVVPCAILDVGHFTLEEEMIRRLALLLKKRLNGVTVSFLPGRDPFVPYSLSSEVPEVLS